MPLISTKPVQLPEAIGMYVDALRKQHSSIAEVWLIGPRANATEARGKEWELLMFADDAVLETVRSDPAWHRDDVSLRVVVDGERFQSPWGEPRPGRLSDMKWRAEDLQSASYVEPGAGRDGATSRLAAVRVR
jgi:hypothetical protein